MLKESLYDVGKVVTGITNIVVGMVVDVLVWLLMIDYLIDMEVVAVVSVCCLLRWYEGCRCVGCFFFFFLWLPPAFFRGEVWPCVAV